MMESLGGGSYMSINPLATMPTDCTLGDTSIPSSVLTDAGDSTAVASVSLTEASAAGPAARSGTAMRQPEPSPLTGPAFTVRRAAAAPGDDIIDAMSAGSRSMNLLGRFAQHATPAPNAPMSRMRTHLAGPNAEPTRSCRSRTQRTKTSPPELRHVADLAAIRSEALAGTGIPSAPCAAGLPASYADGAPLLTTSMDACAPASLASQPHRPSLSVGPVTSLPDHQQSSWPAHVQRLAASAWKQQQSFDSSLSALMPPAGCSGAPRSSSQLDDSVRISTVPLSLRRSAHFRVCTLPGMSTGARSCFQRLLLVLLLVAALPTMIIACR
jgi:hypothetical protein